MNTHLLALVRSVVSGWNKLDVGPDDIFGSDDAPFRPGLTDQLDEWTKTLCDGLPILDDALREEYPDEVVRGAEDSRIYSLLHSAHSHAHEGNIGEVATLLDALSLNLYRYEESQQPPAIPYVYRPTPAQALAHLDAGGIIEQRDPSGRWDSFLAGRSFWESKHPDSDDYRLVDELRLVPLPEVEDAKVIEEPAQGETTYVGSEAYRIVDDLLSNLDAGDRELARSLGDSMVERIRSIRKSQFLFSGPVDKAIKGPIWASGDSIAESSRIEQEADRTFSLSSRRPPVMAGMPSGFVRIHVTDGPPTFKVGDQVEIVSEHEDRLQDGVWTVEDVRPTSEVVHWTEPHYNLRQGEGIHLRRWSNVAESELVPAETEPTEYHRPKFPKHASVDVYKDGQLAFSGTVIGHYLSNGEWVYSVRSASGETVNGVMEEKLRQWEPKASISGPRFSDGTPVKVDLGNGPGGESDPVSTSGHIVSSEHVEGTGWTYTVQPVFSRTGDHISEVPEDRITERPRPHFSMRELHGFSVSEAAFINRLAAYLKRGGSLEVKIDGVWCPYRPSLDRLRRDVMKGVGGVTGHKLEDIRIHEETNDPDGLEGMANRIVVPQPDIGVWKPGSGYTGEIKVEATDGPYQFECENPTFAQFFDHLAAGGTVQVQIGGGWLDATPEQIEEIKGGIDPAEDPTVQTAGSKVRLVPRKLELKDYQAQVTAIIEGMERGISTATFQDLRHWLALERVSANFQYEQAERRARADRDSLSAERAYRMTQLAEREVDGRPTEVQLQVAFNVLDYLLAQLGDSGAKKRRKALQRSLNLLGFELNEVEHISGFLRSEPGRVVVDPIPGDPETAVELDLDTISEEEAQERAEIREQYEAVDGDSLLGNPTSGTFGEDIVVPMEADGLTADTDAVPDDSSYITSPTGDQVVSHLTRIGREGIEEMQSPRGGWQPAVRTEGGWLALRQACEGRPDHRFEALRLRQS